VRSYFFNNFYVNGIRNGIQAGHTVDEMWLELVGKLLSGKTSARTKAQLEMLMEFAANHKTFIVLNGGDHATLGETLDLFIDHENPYPWSVFREPGLNDAITSLRIIIPERLYDREADRIARILAKPDRADQPGAKTPADWAALSQVEGVYTQWEEKFLVRKIRCGLAD